MSLTNFKMKSLRDKLNEQAAAAEKAEDNETKDKKIKRSDKKKNQE